MKEKSDGIEYIESEVKQRLNEEPIEQGDVEMSETQPFIERLRNEVSASEQRLRKMREEKLHDFEALKARHEKSDEESERIVEQIVLPRMQELVSVFGEAEFLENDSRDQTTIVLSLPHSIRFPARTTLKMSVAHDQEVRHLLVNYDLEILPIFMKYNKHAQLEVPLDSIDDQKIEIWVEERLLEFTKTYLELEFADQYQKSNLVTEPVSGLRVSKLICEADCEYKGHRYYFLTKENKELFLQNPSQYVSTETVCNLVDHK